MSSIFMRLSSLVTARDLLEPLEPSVAADALLSDALKTIERLHRSDASESLVIDVGEPVGWTYQLELELALKDDDAEYPQRRVRDVMFPLSVTRLISADTSARKLFTILTAEPDNDPWFVVDGKEIVGTVRYDSLFRPESRLCVFALGIELEQQALKLCVDKGEAASWACLSENRQAKARETLDRVQQRRSPRDQILNQIDAATPIPQLLLAYTTFIDKKTIITKRRLLPEINQKDIKRVFEDMEHVRNRCAHPDLYDEPFVSDPAEFREILQACHRVLHAIEEQLLPAAPSEGNLQQDT